jgi:2-isopropylmalate synthase
MKLFDHRKYAAAVAVPIQDRQWPSRTITQAPRWASVDLRDGNQALLEPMSVEKKRKLWGALVKVGFKEIEVGFPSASQPDYDFVRWLIEARQIPEDVTIQVLVQAREELIVRTFESLAGVERAIVHLYNSTSTVQRERVFGLERSAIVRIAEDGARRILEESKKRPEIEWTFEYSPESFSNTEPEFVVEICDAVMGVWQPTPERRCIINLPATVESSTPNVFADQVEYFCRHLAKRECCSVSVHTHNDRGCAVAAAELAVLAGADRVEGTLFGNGERTGNMDITTMAMNLYSQGIDPRLDLSNPDEIIGIAVECTGLPLHPRHPWFGELVYTAFSGSHQDAIRKCLNVQKDDEPWQVAYLPIDPKDLGRDYQAVIRVNSQSGKGGIAFVLERDFGLVLPRWLQVDFAQIVQKVSEVTGGEVESTTIHALFAEHYLARTEPLAVANYRIERHDGHDRIETQLVDGRDTQTISGSGEGALSAFIDALMRHTGLSISVLDYSEHAVTTGTDAEAIAYVQLSLNGRRVGGAGQSHDTISASLRAVLSALNRSEFARSRTPIAA